VINGQNVLYNVGSAVFLQTETFLGQMGADGICAPPFFPPAEGIPAGLVKDLKTDFTAPFYVE
jgi:hypothetical protein